MGIYYKSISYAITGRRLEFFLFRTCFQAYGRTLYPTRNDKTGHTNGSVVKEYPEDTPYPSRLILGYEGKRPIHVVSAYNPADDTEYVITAYELDTVRWTENFTERR